MTVIKSGSGGAACKAAGFQAVGFQAVMQTSALTSIYLQPNNLDFS